MARREINFVRCLKCGKILQCSRYDTSALLRHIRIDHPEVGIDKVHDTNKRPKAKESETSNAINKPHKNQTTDTHSTEGPLHRTKKDTESTKGSAASNDSEFECQCTDEHENEADKISRKDFVRKPEMIYQKSIHEERNAGKSGDQRESEVPYYVPEDDLTHISIKSELLQKYPEIKDCEFCPRDPNAKVIYTRRYKITTPSTISAASVPRTPRKRHFYRTTIERWRPANGIIYCPKCGCHKRPLIETRTERFTQNQCCASCLLSCWPLCFIPCIFPSGYEVEHLHCSNCKTFLGVYNRSTNCIKPNREFMTIGRQNNIKLKPFPQGRPKSEVMPRKSTTSTNDSLKSNSNRLPSIVVDGKELHPDMVARLQKFKKYGSLAGIDLEAVMDSVPSINTGDFVDSFRDDVPENGKPSVGGKTYMNKATA